VKTQQFYTVYMIIHHMLYFSNALYKVAVSIGMCLKF